ncbi:MAG TPA: hypothetical protein VGD88_11270 [Opitutaceae bacterium]
MSIVPSFIGLRDPLTSLFAKTGSRAQVQADAGTRDFSGHDAAAKSAHHEMQIAQHALRQLERIDPLLQPIA